MKVIGDSDKNNLSGMVGMKSQLGQKRMWEEEMETATWTSPTKSFHVKEKKAGSSYNEVGSVETLGSFILR